MQRFLYTFFLVGLISSLATSTAAQTPIYDIQYTTEPSGDSPYVGQVVSTSGVVTAVHYDGFLMHDGTGPWQAIFIYTFTAGPAIGDQVELTGTVSEYFGMTEIKDLTAFTIVSHENPVTPLVVSASVASQEQYESVFLRVDEIAVTALLSDGEWTVDGVLICNDTNDYLYFPQIGDQLDSLTGTLFYSYGDFKLVSQAFHIIRSGQGVYCFCYAAFISNHLLSTQSNTGGFFCR